LIRGEFSTFQRVRHASSAAQHFAPRGRGLLLALLVPLRAQAIHDGLHARKQRFGRQRTDAPALQERASTDAQLRVGE